MKKVFLFLTFAAFSFWGRAQRALDKTEFEAPKHLVAAKGKTEAHNNIYSNER